MLYRTMLRLPILALNLTQDGPSGQSNGPERRGRLDEALARYNPGTSGNQIKGRDIKRRPLPSKGPEGIAICATLLPRSSS